MSKLEQRNPIKLVDTESIERWGRWMAKRLGIVGELRWHVHYDATCNVPVGGHCWSYAEPPEIELMLGLHVREPHMRPFATWPKERYRAPSTIRRVIVEELCHILQLRREMAHGHPNWLYGHPPEFLAYVRAMCREHIWL